jgi:hypothetical protein
VSYDVDVTTRRRPDKRPYHVAQLRGAPRAFSAAPTVDGACLAFIEQFGKLYATPVFHLAVDVEPHKHPVFRVYRSAQMLSDARAEALRDAETVLTATQQQAARTQRLTRQVFDGLITTVENLGGLHRLTELGDDVVAPNADPDLIGIGESYLRVCEVLRIQPKYAKETPDG